MLSEISIKVEAKSSFSILKMCCRCNQNTESNIRKRAYDVEDSIKYEVWAWIRSVLLGFHQFCPYLLGHDFHFRTNHGSLTWLQNFKKPEGQLAWWIEKLQEYKFIIYHCKWTQHGNADALRLPCHQCGRHLGDSKIYS